MRATHWPSPEEHLTSRCRSLPAAQRRSSALTPLASHAAKVDSGAVPGPRKTAGTGAACTGPCLSGRAAALGAGAPPPHSAAPRPSGTAAAPPAPCPSAKLERHAGLALALSKVSAFARPSDDGGAEERVRPNQYAPAAASSAPRACTAAAAHQRRRHTRCTLARPLRWPQAVQGARFQSKPCCTPHTYATKIDHK